MSTDIVRRNIELAFAVVRQAAADEEFASEMRERGSEGPIALIPADDAELAEANRNIASEARQAGEQVQELGVTRRVQIR